MTIPCSEIMHTFMYLKGKFVLFNDAARAHGFSYYQLLAIKDMVIVKFSFRKLVVAT